MENICFFLAHVLLGVSVMIRASSDYVSSVCEAAEEGTSHTITFALFLEPNSIIEITAYGIPVGTCYASYTCSSFFPNRYNMSRSQNKTFEIVQILIYNVTKKTSNFINDIFVAKPLSVYVTEKYECLLTVFTKVSDGFCSQHISDDGISVSCFTNKVYPPAICQILLIINNTIIATTARTTYRHDRLPGNAMYFASNCTIFVPKTNLCPGVYDVKVTMYPNVTNNDTDIKYGKNISLYFTLEKPRVIISQCPKVADEGSDVTCNCTEENTHPLSVDLRWYDLENNLLTTSNVLKCIVDKMKSGIYCQANNSFGWRSDKVFFNVSVLYLDTVRINVNGKQVKNDIVEEPNSSFVVLCEGMGNPVPQVKLYKGQIIIAQSLKSVNITSTSTCNSSSVLTCSAEQENKKSSASVNVFSKCPLKFRSTVKQPVGVKVNCKISPEILIVLDIYGYPKPIRYYIVQNDSVMTRFHNVSDGNASEDGNLIEYNENGTLTLTLKCPAGNEGTNYVFNLDNGISPALNYSFYIEPEIVSHQQSIVLYRLVIASGAVSSFVIVSLMVLVCYFCKSKDKRDNKTKQGADAYVELIYEDINDNDQTDAGSRECYDNYGYRDNEMPVVLEIRRNSGGRIDDTVVYSCVGEERKSIDEDDEILGFQKELSDVMLCRGLNEDDTCVDEDNKGDYRLYTTLDQGGKGGKRLIRGNLYDTLKD